LVVRSPDESGIAQLSNEQETKVKQLTVDKYISPNKADGESIYQGNICKVVAKVTKNSGLMAGGPKSPHSSCDPRLLMQLVEEETGKPFQFFAIGDHWARAVDKGQVRPGDTIELYNLTFIASKTGVWAGKVTFVARSPSDLRPKLPANRKVVVKRDIALPTNPNPTSDNLDSPDESHEVVSSTQEVPDSQYGTPPESPTMMEEEGEVIDDVTDKNNEATGDVIDKSSENLLRPKRTQGVDDVAKSSVAVSKTLANISESIAKSAKGKSEINQQAPLESEKKQTSCPSSTKNAEKNVLSTDGANKKPYTVTSGPPTKTSKYTYTKLEGIQKVNAKYNFFAVVITVSKELSDTRNGNMMAQYYLRDESTMSEHTDELKDFQLSIFGKKNDHFPDLKYGSLVRVHHVKAGVWQNKMVGTVFSPNTVSVLGNLCDMTEDFDFAGSFIQLSDSDLKRLAELKQWWNDKHGSVPVTLSDLTVDKYDKLQGKLLSLTVNVIEQIEEDYNYNPKVVLRVTDGTTCPLPTRSLPDKASANRLAVEVLANRLVVDVFVGLHKAVLKVAKAGRKVKLDGVMLIKDSLTVENYVFVMFDKAGSCQLVTSPGEENVVDLDAEDSMTRLAREMESQETPVIDSANIDSMEMRYGIKKKAQKPQSKVGEQAQPQPQSEADGGAQPEAKTDEGSQPNTDEQAQPQSKTDEGAQNSPHHAVLDLTSIFDSEDIESAGKRVRDKDRVPDAGEQIQQQPQSKADELANEGDEPMEEERARVEGNDEEVSFKNPPAAKTSIVQVYPANFEGIVTDSSSNSDLNRLTPTPSPDLSKGEEETTTSVATRSKTVTSTKPGNEATVTSSKPITEAASDQPLPRTRSRTLTSSQLNTEPAAVCSVARTRSRTVASLKPNNAEAISESVPPTTSTSKAKSRTDEEPTKGSTRSAKTTALEEASTTATSAAGGGSVVVTRSRSKGQDEQGKSNKNLKQKLTSESYQGRQAPRRRRN